jgi:hypothetical protein
MASHFVAINDEPYDRSTIYGVFDTLEEAQAHVDAGVSNVYGYLSMISVNTDIIEYDGPDEVAAWESLGRGFGWKPRGY